MMRLLRLSRWTSSTPLRLGALALAYFVLAALGLGLAVPGTNATAIWIPTGLAIAATLRFGQQVWPAIFLGAFAINGLLLARLGLSPLPLLGGALAAASGNAAEALLAGFLVRRVTGTRHPFDRVAHVLTFILAAGALGPALSALAGTTGFCLATGRWPLFRTMGAAWWVGDAVAALVLAPLLLGFRRADLAALPIKVHRDALLAGALVCAFWFWVCPLYSPLAFLFFPLLVLGTARLGPFYASALVALLAVLATTATMWGIGPFSLPVTRSASLLLQQGFIATLAITTLVLAAALQERRHLEERLRVQNRLYRTLSDVNQAIVRVEDRIDLLAQTCRILTETGGFSQAWAGLKHESGRVVPEASAGFDPDLLASLDIRWDDAPSGRGVAGRAIRDSRGVMIRDCLDDPDYAPWRALAVAMGFRTCCAFPVLKAGAVSGVLVIYHRDPQAIGTEDLHLLEELTGDLGYALEGLETRKDLVESERRLRKAEAGLLKRATQLGALNTLMTRLNTTLELSASAQAAVDGCLAAAAPDQVLLFLREGESLRLLACAVPSEDPQDHRLGQCLCGLAARDGAPVYSLDIATDRRCTWEECRRAGVTSFAVLPLKNGDEVLGVLGLASTARRDFHNQSTFLETLAAQVSVGLQNALLHQRVKAHAAELERCVEQRTAMLREANEDLLKAVARAQSADRAKSAFLSAMSHELRTPLNSVIGFTGVLLGGLAGRLQPQQEEPLRIVQRNGRHLLDLINDVLDLSKIEAAEMRMAAHPFDLVQTLRESLESLAPAAASKGLELRHAFAVATLPLTGDRRRVAQIVLNLLSNAVKFTEAGSVTLSLDLEAVQARVAVQDTGPGIAALDLPRLFREFEQLDTGLARRSEGTGLGLALSRRLARLMGGDIVVASRPARGSTFTLLLPL
jgi:signal transduction histidine kinase/integral membrane sensor domain MASE1